MPHKLEGFCAVCGAETIQRCSACSEHGFDLFLCGREHQKLVWYAHKRVCGSKAYPFALPLLTPAEADDIKARLLEPFDMTEGRQLWRDTLAPSLRFVPEGVNSLVDKVTEGLQDLALQPDMSRNILTLLRVGRSVQADAVEEAQERAAFEDSEYPQAVSYTTHENDEPFTRLTIFLSNLNSAMSDVGRPLSSFETTQWYASIAGQVLIGCALISRHLRKYKHFLVGTTDEDEFRERVALVSGCQKALCGVLERIWEEDVAAARIARKVASHLPAFHLDPYPAAGQEEGEDGGDEEEEEEE